MGSIGSGSKGQAVGDMSVPHQMVQVTMSHVVVM
jgi:hypothetical protein